MDHLTRVLRRCHGVIALGLLAAMFGLGITSMAGDSAIVDEIAHIPAAYSYLHYGDYRLNPEHPPLIKDLAAIPLQFMHLNFPNGPNSPYITQINGQWDTGWLFLYHSGNDANAILFWSRLPILLLAVAFGGFLYIWTRRVFGTTAALLCLLFYTMSPNILANSRYVTTDLGASALMFVAMTAYFHYSEHPTKARLGLLSLTLAAAQLSKFSALMLYPILLLLAITQTYLWQRPTLRQARARTYIGGLVVASILSIGIVWIFYALQTTNLTAHTQRDLIAGSLTYGPAVNVVHLLQSMSGVPVLRPLVQFLLGVCMVFGRVSGGNTTYFLGQVTNQSFRGYFPVLFLLKTQIAFLILMIGAIGYGLSKLIRRQSRLTVAVKQTVRNHFIEFGFGFFAVFYFGISVAGNLNLGIRHILPIYPPLFVVISVATLRLYKRLPRPNARRIGAAALVLLLGWYAAATIWVYPSFVAYFNEFMGGPANADNYFSDSSVDWGQDLLRLRTYMNDHHIESFGIDYFGGGEVGYYFPDPKRAVVWHAQDGRYPGEYYAVSETYLENDRYYAKKDHHTGYDYLRAMKPIAKIGYSIYVYKLR